jgi:hypothetical protein
MSTMKRSHSAGTTTLIGAAIIGVGVFVVAGATAIAMVKKIERMPYPEDDPKVLDYWYTNMEDVRMHFPKKVRSNMDIEDAQFV